MARLSLIQKQKPGSGNLKPVLRTQAGVRSRLEWDLQEQESHGPDTWEVGAQQVQSWVRQTGMQTLNKVDLKVFPLSSGDENRWEAPLGTDAGSSRDPFVPSTASSEFRARAQRGEGRLARGPLCRRGMQVNPPASARVLNKLVQENRP